MREFLKDIFTLRTVYIDKGAGKWAVKKRFHPFMRAVLSVLLIFACGIIYSKSGTVKHNNAEAITNIKEEVTVTTAKLIEPEPVKADLPPVSVSERKPVIIPLNNKDNKISKHNEIILPSEADPDTDKIIGTSKIQPKRATSNDKYRIVVNKSDFTLSLFKGNELIKTYPVAVGKNTGDKQRVGDNRTPVGNFKIVSIENASNWKHDFRDGKGKIAGAYGPWFLRLDAKGWRGIGIHGTHDPDSRGSNATEGCIRLSNEDIAELKENYAYRNMPVEIREN